MIRTKRHRMLLLTAVLWLIGGLMLPAMAEVVITISDNAGSSSIMQNAESETADAGGTDADGDGTGTDGADDAADADGTANADPANVPASPGGTGGDPEAREAFITDIIDLAEQEYKATGGKRQEAQYASSIYVCKNFTVYLFRQNAKKYRMAEFPDVELVIPDNLPRDECGDYVYGIAWKDVPASEGNPFYVAAEFRYDNDLSKDENREAAREFLRQVKRGDYFQMAANYYYGVGAHSMIYIADYDPDTDMVHWTDSNMKGEKRNGIRYGYVQFDAEKEIDWFVDAFCRKKYGATLYRLRDDIIYAP